MSEKNKQTIDAVNESFLNNRAEKYLDMCSENTVWNMRGGESIVGKDNIRKFFASMGEMDPPVFNIEHTFADETAGACWGTMKMDDDEGKKTDYSFCDTYRFNSSGEITELNSFMIKTK